MAHPTFNVHILEVANEALERCVTLERGSDNNEFKLDYLFITSKEKYVCEHKV